MVHQYNNDKCVNATKKYLEVAEKNNLSLTQLALAFVNTRPFLTSNIIGATTIDQLKENIASIDIELSDDIINEINEITLIPQTLRRNLSNSLTQNQLHHIDHQK